MTINPLIFLILLSFGLLITFFIIGLAGIIKELKKKSNEYMVFLIMITITMILLIPVIFGLIQDYNL
ncbi:MAG: hypothetical protein ACFFG0_31505 [Candidatus Thorarchaeota archaeon]